MLSPIKESDAGFKEQINQVSEAKKKIRLIVEYCKLTITPLP